MGTLRLRNCTVWDVHYWRKGGNSEAIAGPGQEGTYDWGATYTLGVKRMYVSPDGKNYRQAVNQNGIYYAVWNAGKQELEILSEHEANLYPWSEDNAFLTKWIKRLPDWMSALDGQYSLNKYSIPGTHDSGTERTGDGAAHTQNFGISAQLEDGIRFLDIRLDGVTEFDQELVVKHGCILCFLNFSDVLNSCKSFLENHQGETIIMLVNASGCLYNNIESRFKHYLEQEAYRNLFYLGETMPALNQVRGKIVLFRRFRIDDSSILGVDLSHGWEDNKTFSLTTPQGVRFEIEDQYKDHDTHVKLAAVEASLNSSLADSSDNIMHITYNSISFGGHTPYQYAWGGGGVDPIMNPSLESFLLARPGTRRFGVVMLDFYNNQGSQNGIVEALVRSNDGLVKN
jgi:1-phosphatidylinositol phosphodiesterase